MSVLLSSGLSRSNESLSDSGSFVCFSGAKLSCLGLLLSISGVVLDKTSDLYFRPSVHGSSSSRLFGSTPEIHNFTDNKLMRDNNYVVSDMCFKRPYN